MTTRNMRHLCMTLSPCIHVENVSIFELQLSSDVLYMAVPGFLNANSFASASQVDSTCYSMSVGKYWTGSQKWTQNSNLQIMTSKQSLEI